MWRRTLFSLCFCVCAVFAEEPARQSRVVNLAQGPVRGYKDPESGVYFFQSIPYASAPKGTNKYKAPLPPPTWTEPLEAVSKGIICPQSNAKLPGYPDFDNTMQEDCLIASVYVPDVKEKSLSVVVFVHGGAFQVGAGDWMLPTKLVAEKNVIYVTFNYRLGFHGFLCLGTEDVPGNAGMKDQVAALLWVKNNIASFGGSPNDITIHGSSAGAASVELLMLSKSTEGLFHKVIADSGSGIAQWAIQSDPLENAKRFAKQLNFNDVDDINALEKFYKTVPFESLASLPFLHNYDSTFGLSPCVERATGAEEVFLDSSPVDILKSGQYIKVPILYGYTNMEGLLRIDVFESWRRNMTNKYVDFLPPDMKFKSEEEKLEIAEKVQKFYFGRKPVKADRIVDYIEYFTDVIIASPMLRTLKYHLEADHGKIYLYEYSFTDDITPLVPFSNVKGATHCAQTMAIFEFTPGIDPKQYTVEFEDMTLILRDIWGDFIKTGKPVPRGSSLPLWPPVNKKRLPYMSLGEEITLVRETLNERRSRFWEDLYETHYQNPIPPPSPTALRTDL